MKNDEINWNQVKIDASINAMNALLSSSWLTWILEFVFKRQVADIAVKYAEELVEELKKKIK